MQTEAVADKPARRRLPESLPRITRTHASKHDTCPDCGGKLRSLGEDASEMLEYVPAHFEVIPLVRPKLSCAVCERIVQEPAPSRPIDRGLAGLGLLAHVLVSKYADHIPLEAGFDLDLVGFSDEELEALAPPEETREGQTDEDAVPDQPKQPVTVAGDLWLVGEHRLLCGNATSLQAIETVLAGALADMTFTDPPYNVDYEGKTAKKLKIQSDAMGSKLYDFLREACANVLAVTKGAVYVCMSFRSCTRSIKRSRTRAATGPRS